MTTSKKILWVAIIAEAILITAGLALAITMATAAYEAHQSLALAASAATFPILLAALELLKIPAGIALYKARWLLKPVAVVVLAGGVIATYDTVVAASMTWFRAIQYEVQVAQTDLRVMQDTLAVDPDDDQLIEQLGKNLEQIDTQIALMSASPTTVALREQIDRVSADLKAALGARDAARMLAAEEYDRDQQILQQRMDRGGSDAAEAAKSQRALPTRRVHIERAISDWDARYGADNAAEVSALRAERDRLSGELTALEQDAAPKQAAALADLRAERSEQQAALSAALQVKRETFTDRQQLKKDIEAQKLLVDKLTGQSLIHDISAKVYAKPAAEVTEEEANTVTAWAVFSAATVIALATGLAGLLSAHLDDPGPRLSLGQAIRRYAVMRRWRRKQTVEKVVYQDRIVTRVLPSADDIPDLNERSLMQDLFNRRKEA